MSELSLSRRESSQTHVWSWAASLLVHGLAVGAAVALLSGLRLAPQPEPFRWVVSKVESPVATNPRSPSAQAQSSKPPRPARTQPAEANLAPEPPVSPIQRHSEQAAAPAPMAQEAIRPAEPAPLEPVSQMVAHQTLLPQAHSPVASAETDVPVSVSQAQAVPVPQAPPTTLASVAPPLQPGPATQPAPSAQTKADYGWLAQTIRTKVEQLKQYPHMARANRWEGRVVLRAVIGEDGQLVDLKIAESSGHSVLDEAALDVLKNAAPLTLPQPLGRSQVVVQVPISYRLR